MSRDIAAETVFYDISKRITPESRGKGRPLFVFGYAKPGEMKEIVTPHESILDLQTGSKAL